MWPKGSGKSSSGPLSLAKVPSPQRCGTVLLDNQLRPGLIAAEGRQ